MFSFFQVTLCSAIHLSQAQLLQQFGAARGFSRPGTQGFADARFAGAGRGGGGGGGGGNGGSIGIICDSYFK